jgi:hypothetical protein
MGHTGEHSRIKRPLARRGRKRTKLSYSTRRVATQHHLRAERSRRRNGASLRRLKKHGATDQPRGMPDGNSALSGSDRHDFAVSEGLDIANWGPAKESPVLAIELARAFVADLERCTCRIQFTREHALPRGMQAKLLSGLTYGQAETESALARPRPDCRRRAQLLARISPHKSASHPSHVRITLGRLEPQSAPTFRPSALEITRAPVVTSLATRKGGAVSATVVRRVPDRDTLHQPLVSPSQSFIPPL